MNQMNQMNRQINRQQPRISGKRISNAATFDAITNNILHDQIGMWWALKTYCNQNDWTQMFIGCSRKPINNRWFTKDADILYAKIGQQQSDEDWEILVQLADGRYAFIVANTDYYTGFEIGGKFKVYVSEYLSTIVNYAMSEVQYVHYIRNTIHAHSECGIIPMAVSTNCAYYRVLFSRSTFNLKKKNVG